MTVPVVRITSPIKDQNTRGTLLIIGAAVSPNFARYEIAYAKEPEAEAWIIIGGNNQMVPNGTLLAWNTRPIPDGAYALRLQVFTTESTVTQALVRNITLSNQAAAAPSQTAVPGAGASTVAVPAAGSQQVNELDTARSTLAIAISTVERLPSAFVRGARWAVYALGALIAYTLLKQLGMLLWRRFLRKPVDYGR